MDIGNIIWQKESLDAMDVARSLRRPTLAKLDSSVYGMLGQGTGPTNGCPEDGQVFLLHSRQCSTRVTASNMVWDGQRYVEAGPSLAVPLAYPGWFRIIQHPSFPIHSMKKSSGPCSSIKELSAIGASSFLALQQVHCFHQPHSDTAGVYQKKAFPRGEIFTVHGVCIENISKPSFCMSCCIGQKKNKSSVKYLRCTSSNRCNVLIPLDTRGMFWPIGKSDNILQPGFVYQIQELVDAVKESPGFIIHLVHGKPPPKHERFSRVLLLESVVKQDVIVACSLSSEEVEPTLLEFPLHSYMAFILASNGTNIKRVRDIIDFVSQNLTQYMSNMKVVKTMVLKSVVAPGNKLKSQLVEKTHTTHHLVSGDLETDSFVSDYDTIPFDDPVYENQGDNFLLQTAQRLRQELAKRAASLKTEAEQDYLSPSTVYERKYAQRKIQHQTHHQPMHGQRLDSFLAASVDEMERHKSAGSDDLMIENDEDVQQFLDNMFDCDLWSTSTSSGAVMVATDHDDARLGKSHPQNSEPGRHSAADMLDDQHSSLSSLYKKVKCVHQVKKVRSDSGIGYTPKCDSCCDLHKTLRRVVGSDITSWKPPKELSSMSVEEVALSLRYIGMRREIIERFMEEQIDGHQLSDMEEDLLKEGFPQMNALDRKKLMNFKAGWRPKREY